jgi:hypothetical protein
MHILVTDDTKGTTLYQQFTSAGDGNPNWIINGTIYHMKWQFLDLPFDASTVAVGDSITLKATAAGCNQGGHWGYMYVDAFGSTNPGVVIPSPTSISPNGGSSSGGTTVTITGSNFTGDGGVTGVSIGGTAASSFTVDSDTQITFVTPAHAEGLVSVTVTNQNGSGSVPNSFTFSSATPPTSFSNGAPSNGVYQATYPGATFSANGTPAPSYSISSGSLPNGLNLNSSTGELTGTPTVVGAFPFTVQATNTAGSKTQSYSITIDKASTSVTITSDNNDPSRYGEAYSIHFHAVSTNSSATPTGSVSVSDGTNTPCSTTLDGSGNGACSLPTTWVTSPSTLSLTATYAGNGNFYSSSDSEPHTSIKADTSLALSSSNLDAVYGEILTYTATAATTAPGSGTPVGSVQFYVNSSPYGSPVSLNGSGVASLSLPYNYLLVGSYPVYAIYSGNINFNGSTAATLTQGVKPAPTTLSVTSSQNPTDYGSSITISLLATANNPSLATPAGTVVLKIDGIQYGSVMTLNASGAASRSIPYINLWPGTHAITAAYTPASPAQFVASSGAVTPAQLVNKANPVFSFSADVASPVASQPVVFSVQVAHPSVPQSIPTGSVQFYVDGVALGSPVTLDDLGSASSPADPNLSAAAHSITVAYSGDDYFLSVPTSSSFSKTVARAASTTSITNVAASSAVVGQPIPVSVRVQSVSPATSIPSGSVTVSNGTNSCSASLALDGTGSCSLAATQPGSPNLTATYIQSSDFLSSLSSAVSGPAVSKADPVVSISGFSPSSPVVGQSVTVNFSVSALAPGAGTPSGTVTVSNGTGVSCQAALSSGSASCSFSFPSSGPTSLTASYPGDTNFNSGASSATTGPSVALAATTLSVVSSVPNSVFGQPVHFTAALAITAPGAGSPSGSVQFKIDGANFADPVALSDLSAASSDISTIPVGAHTFSAVYLGDSNFSSATSSSPAQSVAKADTSLAISSSPNPSPYGVSVAVTATVSANAPSIAVPSSGSVQFVFDGVNYGSPVPIDASGKAHKILPYTALWVGTHSITANYLGSSSFNPSSASTLNQEVGLGHVTLSLTPSAALILPNTSITFSATVIGNGSNTPAPSGTLQFVVDGDNLGSPVPFSGSGPVTSSSFSSAVTGFHSASLVYSGDDYYQSTTTPFSNLFKIADAVSGFSNGTPPSATFGLPYSFTFSTNGSPAPTFSVTGGALPDGLTLDPASGVLSGTPSAAGDFSFTIHADNGTGHADGIYSIHVSQIATSISVLPSISSPIFGQPFQFVASVSSSAAAKPSGSVQFQIDGVDFGDPVPLANGSASSATPSGLSAGSHSFSASYSGAANQLASSTSLPDASISVAQDASTTTLSFSASPVVFGQPFSLHAVVAQGAPSQITPLGQVQFYADSAALGDPVDLASGSADSSSIPGALLAGSSHSYSAVYLGNANTTTSTSPTLTQTVQQTPTHVVISSLHSSVVYGTPVDMTISVLPDHDSTAVPEGSVQLAIDGVPFASSLTLANGQAVRTVPYLNLWPGDHAVTAVYTPSGSPVQFLASNNNSLPYHQVVTKAHPLITLTPSVSNPVASQPITYSVSVAHETGMPTQGTPSGTIQFIVDGLNLGSPQTLDKDGLASSPVTALTAGAHSITLAYSGDDYFFSVPAVQFPPFSQSASQKVTSTAILSASPASAVVGQPVTVTAKVGVVGAPSEVPTGFVTLSDGSHSCSTSTLAADGSAACQITFTAPAAPVSLTASFTANGDYAGSVSPAFTGLSVAKASALVSVTGFSPAHPVTGQPVTFSFSAAAIAPGAGSPSGSVTLDAGNGLTCSADLATGHCDLVFPKAGSPSLTVSYAGDSLFLPSAPAPVASLPSIAKADTSISVASSASPSVFGQPVRFSAAVIPSAPGSGSPSGSVQFYIGAAKFGDPVPLVSGQAVSADLSSLSVGDHSFSAVYSGDADFSTSSSSTETQSVASDDTSISVTTDVNPSPYGLSVLATASVSPKTPGTILPSDGVVTF